MNHHCPLLRPYEGGGIGGSGQACEAPLNSKKSCLTCKTSPQYQQLDMRDVKMLDEETSSSKPTNQEKTTSPKWKAYHMVRR